jgi:hypothetical protein
VVARVSSENNTTAVVTVRDESGAQLAKMVRDNKTTLTVSGGDDQPLVTVDCDGDGPWPATDVNGRTVGELLPGKPDPSRKPGLAEWALFTDLALDRAAHQKGQHLGIRRVVRYSYAPLAPGPMPAPLALLPLLAGLVY